MDIAKDHALNGSAAEGRCLHMIKLLFFQRGEKALHSGVVVTTACAAHALPDAESLQRGPKRPAGELAAPVRVHDHAPDILGATVAAGVFQRLDTQLGLHVIGHLKALDAAIEAVQHRC